jgi:NAD(P)-dependent dehydrogenase (short-subunit alcohol dehydrogenase family)/putative sterol carrier protein
VPIPGAAEEVEEKIRFDGKVAVVTGAGAGLGRAYALELARRGAKVVVNDLGGARDGSGEGSASPADKVVEEIKALGGEAVANYDNVASAEGGENIVKTALDVFGKIDILINNAGILRDKSFLKMEPENWNAVLDVHLNGAYNVTRPAMQIMRENGYGRIVMTSSAAGLYGNFGQTNYSAAKMALVGFMSTLKLEGMKYDINVNTVSPIAASRLTEDVMPPDLFEKSKPEFVVPLVLYLCSDECKETGGIFSAGMGYFNRVAVLTAPAVQLGDPDNVPTPEQISDNWEKINSLEGATEMGDANAAIFALVSPPAATEPEDEKAEPETGLDVNTVFEKMPEAFNPEAAKGVDVVFQYQIEGPGGGDWIVTVKDGACKIEAGAAEKPTCTLKISDSDFIDLVEGRLNPMTAYTSGKLKIGGDIMKSQLIEKLFPMGK